MRYGTTALLVGLCFVLFAALHERNGIIGFYLMLPAIFAASVMFDRGSGIFAVVLSCLLLYLALRHTGSIALPAELVLPFVIFGVMALGLAVVSEAFRTAWEHATIAERQKDLLLSELGHRTQNNLAMVISVLSLQARSKTSPETRAALANAVARVQAIASAHQHFQPVRQNGSVEMRLYLEELCRHLGDSLRDVRPIAIKVESDAVHLPTEQAVPIGLITNELVTNAFKHAFPDDRSGTVRVILKKTTTSLVLAIEDNGVGCPTDRQEHIGSRLIRLLAEQLEAKLTYEDAGPGCRVRVEFIPRYAVA
ncbi:sensor histidine kinase [Bradyrhizobium sp. LHD-71]|uniref:sensor histidine kinase n=1 Tax=Bradyrhizobium sp. LHD-71 TaxID=3072141 RepID=UPI00280CAAD4|nr:sensor histidine kinase [Bradyrhizobium sp. LHD-71]MDQ8730538.1 sensor histidine kinase [Bradyrhizobium sp. LHD-71]